MSVAVLNGNPVSRLHSLRAAIVFPGRTSLYPHEVARALSVSLDQVNRWIEFEEIGSIRISCASNGRAHYRIPVAEYDAFILRRSSR